MHRGSRKHILDWTSRKNFLGDFVDLISLPEFVVSTPTIWQPKGYKQPDEARLDSYGRQFILDHALWNKG